MYNLHEKKSEHLIQLLDESGDGTVIVKGSCCSTDLDPWFFLWLFLGLSRCFHTSMASPIGNRHSRVRNSSKKGSPKEKGERGREETLLCDSNEICHCWSSQEWAAEYQPATGWSIWIGSILKKKDWVHLSQRANVLVVSSLPFWTNAIIRPHQSILITL